ncbi:MAG: acyl-CoA synthetase [Actinomycetota bacterium]|nr:acyl-CoA synthetase [Actinomycetota bacterium]
MFVGDHAQATPDKPAVVMAGSGETITYRELDDASNRLAQLLRAAGLGPGDHVAIHAENLTEYFTAYWAALRSGLYFTTVNRYLTAEEAAYIVNDCGAKALVVSDAYRDLAAELVPMTPDVDVRLMIGGEADGYENFDRALAAHPAEPLAEQPRGEVMLYSSGTTGRPKGIQRPLSGEPVGAPNALVDGVLSGLFGFSADTVYLSPAPLYHSAPLGFTTGVQSLGGTAVVMERFEPAEALRAIEAYSVTHSQWVPTMFTRLLKLPEEVRTAHDLSSHRVAIHAAAPCPVEVKQQMMDWWGPILHEYYAGTEFNGFCYVDPETWLARPGTVGKPILGIPHICDDEGTEQPTGEAGTIYFELEAMPFEYHNDPDKTKGAQHPDHANWSTLGDVGYLDDDGYLYLTDRKAFMIISGGVNIYPQEIEDAMIMHPKIADVAVIGVPDDEMGEQVKAVVQLAEGVPASEDTEQELLDWTRHKIAHYKAPRSVDFRPELPRLPTGKLYKRVLKDEYWTGRATRIGS